MLTVHSEYFNVFYLTGSLNNKQWIWNFEHYTQEGNESVIRSKI